MLMGSADAIPTAPTTAVVFVEDLPEDLQAKAAMARVVCRACTHALRCAPCATIPARCHPLTPLRAVARAQKNFSPGLENLGNTCYLNSTLQCLYSVPELRTALQRYTGAGPGAPGGGVGGAAGPDGPHRLTVAARDLFRQLGAAGDAVAPHTFLTVLRQLFPQFATTGRNGAPMQQDAEECWTGIVATLRARLLEPLALDAAAPASAPAAPAGGATSSVVRELFGIDLCTKLTCGETGEAREERATQYTFKCNISTAVNHVSEGFRLALDASREAHSEVAGRTVLFTGTAQLASLPRVLTVQLMRFFYKISAQEKCKILRAVAFPMLLDVYEFTTPELRAQLDAPRERRKRAEEAALGVKMQPSAAPSAAAASASAASGSAAALPPAAAPQAGGDAEMADAADAAGAAGAAGADAAPAQLAPTGFYSLCALLTHKGREADGGHYVSYVKQTDGSWMEFDDERPIPRTEEEILRLKGGGDHAMAYLCLYRSLMA
jgi:ubiquitin carboxyl-terminal hydrolase 14